MDLRPTLFILYSTHTYTAHSASYIKVFMYIYCNFAKIVETQFSKRIKNFQSNNVLEYTQHAFQAILHSYGTIHHLTCLGTSQQNGRAEQKLHHILHTVRSLILSAKVATPFWGRNCSLCCLCY